MAKRRLTRRKFSRRSLRRSTAPLLPTLLTLANGVCGLGAITLATGDPLEGEEGKLVFLAGLLVFAGMVFDVMDGHFARLTKQTSRFGAELDSLCDMITFGVAPVFIMFTFSDFFCERLPWGHRLLWGIGALYTVSAVLRLARFNVQKKENEATDFFQGLPSPAAAGTVASFAIAIPTIQKLGLPSLIVAADVAAPILTLVLACLMVSRIKYPHIAKVLTRRRNFYQLAEVVFALVVIITFHVLALPLIFCYFVFTPPLNQLREKAVARWRKSREPYTPAPASEDGSLGT
jgi:CDP-diacylglycerol--serine O-phosphatidyltransferase